MIVTGNESIKESLQKNIRNMEWIDVKDRLPRTDGMKVRVKKSNGSEYDAFFLSIYMMEVMLYGIDTTPWWQATGNNRPLHGITHWKPLETKED